MNVPSAPFSPRLKLHIAEKAKPRRVILASWHSSNACGSGRCSVWIQLS